MSVVIVATLLFLVSLHAKLLTAWVYQVYPGWNGNRKAIWARVRNEDHRILFVPAVNEYTGEKRCTVKDVLLAFRIPASKYYYWKSCA